MGLVTYHQENTLRIYSDTPFQVKSTGTAFDPTVVKFEVTDPTGTVTNYVYGTDPEVTRNATGDYELELDVGTTRGIWKVRIIGQTAGGDSRGADIRQFIVGY